MLAGGSAYWSRVASDVDEHPVGRLAEYTDDALDEVHVGNPEAPEAEIDQGPVFVLRETRDRVGLDLGSHTPIEIDELLRVERLLAFELQRLRVEQEIQMGRGEYEFRETAAARARTTR